MEGSRAGRPRVEVQQPGLVAAILAIAHQEGAADPRRRTEMLTLPRCLAELHLELVEEKGNKFCNVFLCLHCFHVC